MKCPNALRNSVRILPIGRLIAIAGVLLFPVAIFGQFAGTLDTTFAPSFDSAVQSIALQQDGQLVVAGNFSTANGASRGVVARLRSDGTLDAGFSPPVFASSGNNHGYAVAVQSDGKILVGGSFESVNGSNRGYLVRLNQNGNLDTTFSDPGLNSIVWDIEVLSDGRILLAGDFTSAGGQSRRKLVRLHSNGSVDTSFQDPGISVYSVVYAVTLDDDGKVLIGGDFNEVHGQPRSYVARLNGNGSLDASFGNANIGNSQFGELVSDIAVLPGSDDILIGGGFPTVGGQTRSNFARLNSNGTLDASFPNLQLDSIVNGIVVETGGKIVIGGFFTTVGGQARGRLARLNGNGTLDTGFSNPDLSAGVNTLVRQPDGRWMAGGWFTSAAGGARSRLARWYGDITGPTRWTPDFTKPDYETEIEQLADEIGELGNYVGLRERNRRGLFFSSGVAVSNHFSFKALPPIDAGGQAPYLWWSPGEVGPGTEDRLFVYSEGKHDLPAATTFESGVWARFSSYYYRIPHYGEDQREYEWYKYLEFPESLPAAPARSQGQPVDWTRLDASKDSLIVVVHGWNPDSRSDTYGDGFEGLLTALSGKVERTANWDLYAYDWAEDAATGGKLEFAFRRHQNGDVGIAIENGAQAAEIGYQHGLKLGELLRSENPGFKKIHFIAHSAGTWVARSAALYYEKAGPTDPDLKMQFTLLDPFCPAEGYDDWAGEPTAEYSVLSKALITSLPNDLNSLALAENYISFDRLIPGTNERFWNSGDGRVGGVPLGPPLIDLQVDSSLTGVTAGGRHWEGHGGPINFYTYTITEDRRYYNDGFDLSLSAMMGDWKNAWSKNFRYESADIRGGWRASLLADELDEGWRSHVPEAGSYASTPPADSSKNAAKPGWKNGAGDYSVFAEVTATGELRMLLIPAGTGSPRVVGPLNVNGDGTFAMTDLDGTEISGRFTWNGGEYELSVELDGVPVGANASQVGGSDSGAAVSSLSNEEDGGLFVLVMPDDTVAVVGVGENTDGSDWIDGGVGQIGGDNSFAVSGANGFGINAQIGGDSTVTGDYTEPEGTNGALDVILTISESSHEAGTAGDDHRFNVVSNGDWSWSKDVSWISTSEAVNQTGNQEFSFTIEENTGTSERIGRITLTAGSRTRTHTVTQAGVPSEHFDSQRVVTDQADLVMDVCAADLDGDGDIDLVSASFLDDTIAWHENLGNGSFGPRQVINDSASSAKSVRAADLDGDGDEDVLIGFNDEVAWHENLGGGTFGAKQTVLDSDFYPHAVRAADLDGDGDFDVLAGLFKLGTTTDDYQVVWFENDGSGGFGGKQEISSFTAPAGDFQLDVEACDLDQDGDLDVLTAAAASTAEGGIVWYRNLGNATFGGVQTISADVDGALKAHAADLDGDGDLDVLSASTEDDKIAHYENLGDGTFGPQQIITTEGNYATCVGAADLDGDGDLDIYTTSSLDNKVAWHENLGGEGFGPQETITNDANAVFNVRAADLDGDGDHDLISASKVDDKIAWYPNLHDAGGADQQVVIGGSVANWGVHMDETGTRTIWIANRGSRSLRVTSLELPEGFSGAWAGSLLPGETAFVEITFSPDSARDYGGQVELTSNAVSGSTVFPINGFGIFDGPDLAITDFRWTGLSGDSYGYEFTVTNLGTQDVLGGNGLSVQAQFSMDDIFGNGGDLDAGGGILGIDSLPAGQSVTRTRSVQIDPGDDTHPFFVLKVDHQEGLREKSEDNNVTAGDILIGAFQFEGGPPPVAAAPLRMNIPSSTSITVPISVIEPGLVEITVSGSGFSAALKVVLEAATSSITIDPLSYDGTARVETATFTISSSQAVSDGSGNAILIPHFEYYMNQQGLDGGTAESRLRDDDGDGENNFIEWMRGSNPGDPSSLPLQFAERRAIDGDTFLAVSYLRLVGGTENGSFYQLSDGYYEARCGPHPGEIGSAAVHLPAPGNLPEPPAGYEWGCVRCATPIESTEAGFLQLRVESH